MKTNSRTGKSRDREELWADSTHVGKDDVSNSPPSVKRKCTELLGKPRYRSATFAFQMNRHDIEQVNLLDVRPQNKSTVFKNGS
jgi:hypothetical protein